MLRKDDPRQPIQDLEPHVKIFLTNKPEDMTEYTEIWGRITRKWALLGAEDKTYDPEIKAWRIFLRWCDVFYRMPDKDGR